MTGEAVQLDAASQPGAEALAYTARRWAVFPVWWPLAEGHCACGRKGCPDAGKHPIGFLAPRGHQDASSDQNTVRAWWQRMPEANVGVRTGRASGLVVVDLDGEVGVQSIRALVDRHGRFPAAWVRTGSGGWHAYLRHPGSRVPCSNGRIGPGIDVRGDGGYVVAPPSLHASGGRYAWRSDPGSSLPVPPEWLTQLGKAQHSQTADLRPIPRGRAPRIAAAELNRQARKVAKAPEGRRNDTLYRSSFRIGRFVGAGLVAHEQALQVLEIAAHIAAPEERKNAYTITRGLHEGAQVPLEVGR